MSNIDKIRQKIERLKGYISVTHFAEELLSFIDSLQQEQPCEDLKGEIREWVNLMVGASFPEQDGDYISEEDYRSVIRQTALHFYELGKQSKEPVNEDLEEAAWGCVLDSIDVNNPVLLPKYKELLLSLFIAGAEWQKGQKPEVEICPHSIKSKSYKEITGDETR